MFVTGCSLRRQRKLAVLVDVMLVAGTIFLLAVFVKVVKYDLELFFAANIHSKFIVTL